MSETKTLWQRCEALGRFEDYKDDHVEMLFTSGRGVIRHDGQCILFIYEDKVRGSEWLADAILCHIERIRFPMPEIKPLEEMSDDEKAAVMKAMNEWTRGPMTFAPNESVVTMQNINEKLREAVDSGQYDHDTDGRHRDPNFKGVPIDSAPLPIPDQLPDVTYVVEAPKQTEPTQEQLKAIWDYVTHLTMEQETRLGIQYVVVGAAMHAEFQLHIKSVASCKDQWRVRIAQGSNGVFRAIEPFDLALACHRLGCFHVANSQIVTESPLQFVSIPVTEWQQLREAHKTIQSILFREIKDVEFES